MENAAGTTAATSSQPGSSTAGGVGLGERVDLDGRVGLGERVVFGERVGFGDAG